MKFNFYLPTKTLDENSTGVFYRFRVTVDEKHMSWAKIKIEVSVAIFVKKKKAKKKSQDRHLILPNLIDSELIRHKERHLVLRISTR